MKTAVSILSEKDIQRALGRIAHQVIEKNQGTQGLALIGIRTRGEHLARRLASIIGGEDGGSPPLGILDIGLHRDDIDILKNRLVIRKTEIGFNINDMHLVIVDDVMFTGRTARAALDALMGLGRPRMVSLAVLVDRGHRELPIRADFVGKNLPTSLEERVRVRLREVDGVDEVVLEREAG
ncbi:MAG: bifunctional pyr operon transcriptional regulator/uracil phosphoribosyltransferase PyrR [Nitrospinota bacterium]